jgi:hypothetical protein
MTQPDKPYFSNKASLWLFCSFGTNEALLGLPGPLLDEPSIFLASAQSAPA